MIQHTFSIVAAIGLGLGASLAHAQATPAGVWKTIDDESKKEKSLIRISEAGGVYTGKLEKLLDPTAKPDAVCDKCSDDRKDKPLVGMTLIKGVKQNEADKATWDGGEILDPNNGKTYKVRLTPGEGGKTLAVRGYIGAPLLGRTQTWIRVE
ncbi:MAG TPA: DUF2147 domain-containing protein [Burkholderiaceae bacterium]|nr:DUF2147 domain-containing protein [Burkholderiaceae bacterium]